MTLQITNPPYGLFKGKNFMTPNVIEFFKLRHGYAELSEGRGIEHEPIFGVTVKPDNEKRSKLFHSRAAALYYIEELS